MTFAERVRPTIINDGRGHDIPSNGRFWIDPSTGRVLRTHRLAGDDASDARVDSVVTYRPHPEWGLLLPAEMRETYDQPARPDACRLVCTATYSKFRRFDVQVDEQIEAPKRPDPS